MLGEIVKREPPADVPCRGYWCHTPDAGLFYECGYGWGAFSCSDCVVNGGNMDPRTGQEVEE